MKRLVYTLTYPDLSAPTQQLPPMTIAGKGASAPVTNCPMPENGLRTSLERCYECKFCGEVDTHWLECSYEPSQQEKDEMERRRKGISTVVKRPVIPVGPEVNDVSAPKIVFSPLKK
jgi:hypothetical protein